MNFTFSVPLWGDWHTLQYLKHVLPSHSQAQLEGRYVVHTNRKRMLEGKIEHDLPYCEVEYIDIDPQPSYFQFSVYHQETFDRSEACVFLQADAAISNGTFKAIRRAVDEGYKHINCCGINTVHDGSEFHFDARMNQWAVEHLIPTLRGNIWGTSDSMMSPQTLYFRDGESFWCHAFHHDPICMVNDGRGVKFAESTLDWITPSYFTPAETTMLSGHDALVVEISPPNKFDRHPRMKMVNATEIAMKVKQLVLPSHTNLFRYAVPIVGEPTDKYQVLIDNVIAMMSNEAFGARKTA